MYEVLERRPERPWAPVREERADYNLPPAEAPSWPAPGKPRSLILHMRENRSNVGQKARGAFSAIGLLFMVTSIAPALRGQWLVPVFSILAIAALTFALDRHSKSRPASEMLELVDGRVRHRDGQGRTVEYPAFWMRLSAESQSPSDLRLFLRGRDGAFEFGRCLSLDERREIAPLVAAALARTRGR